MNEEKERNNESNIEESGNYQSSGYATEDDYGEAAGTLNGVISGAMIGSPFGIVGAVIGGVSGGAVGNQMVEGGEADDHAKDDNVENKESNQS